MGKDILVTTGCMEAVLAPLHNELKSFFSSDDSLCLLMSDAPSSVVSMAALALLREVTDSPIISLNGNQQLTPATLIDTLCKHCNLQSPIKSEGFRMQLDKLCDQLSESEQQYILILETADELSIALRAALAHLVNLQKKKGGHLKLLLLGRSVLSAQLQLFFPDGKREINFSRQSKFYTAWVVRSILDQQGVGANFPPLDVFDVIHDYADGEREKINFVLNKWQVARVSEQVSPVNEIDESAAASLVNENGSRLRSGFWSQQRLGSALIMLALSVGIALHGFRESPVSLALRHTKPVTYSVSLPEMARAQAVQWVAAHRVLPDEELVYVSAADGHRYYHVEFGAYASEAQAKKAWWRIVHHPDMPIQITQHVSFY